MSRAEKVLDLLETVTFTKMGSLVSTDIEQAFMDKLPDTQVRVALTPHEGIFVYFINAQGENAVMLFSQHPEGVPSVNVMPYGETEDFFTADLSKYSPALLLPMMIPNLFDLSWFPSDAIKGLLDPAEKSESYSGNMDGSKNIIARKIGKVLGINSYEI